MKQSWQEKTDKKEPLGISIDTYDKAHNISNFLKEHNYFLTKCSSYYYYNSDKGREEIAPQPNCIFEYKKPI